MANRKYFINLSSEAGASLVESFTSAVGISAEQLSFRRDDALGVELHFLAENPAADTQPDRPFVYVDPTGWTVKVGAGTIDQVPTGGTFTITETSASQTTSAIAYDASAATIQTRLLADCATNFGSCTVSGSAGGPWTVDRVTTGAFASNPTGSGAALTPSGSTVAVVNTEDGTSSLSEKWQISLNRALPIYRESGWAALASASVSVTTVQTGSSGAPKKNSVFRVQWNSDAYAGAVVLTFTGDTTAGSVTLPYNASEEEVVASFVLHTDVDADGVAVVKSGPGDYTIECVGAGISNSSTPALATSSNTLSVPVGLSGALNCNTALVTTLLAGASSASATFEVEITRVSASPETVAYSSEATIYADLIRNVAGGSSTTQVFLTRGDAVAWSGSTTAYTGGAASALDAIVTTSLTAPYALAFNHSTDGFRVYQLTTGTDAESSPDIIRPDDYNASTNAKVWKSIL